MVPGITDALTPYWGPDPIPPGHRRPTREECIAAAGRVFATGRARRDALPVMDAAREAYVPGGRSVDELAKRIRAQREQARKRASTDTSPPTG
ncbi:hypothetical protein [Blastococcus sp. TF02A-35]|uniref:hypothetical protein n=1 Tax=Blastococcus sp. TF02A-35 TaxID=2559612 RepID=UPI001072FF4D|nr:hypothetical protein [Blastococcus sp. TF02A_35]TFV52660.1 hypothetical protein E4P43_05000 [Blastococcus sp. TF02A_35]